MAPSACWSPPVAGAGWALDRYVLDDVAGRQRLRLSAPNASVAEAATNGTATATSYASDTAKISITKVQTGSGSDTVTYFVADVTVTDATIVRSAFANDEFGQNIIANPSEIAADVGAVLAINGDYYGFRDTGIVIRNGVAYRDAGARQGLAFYTDGTIAPLRRDRDHRRPSSSPPGCGTPCRSDRGWSTDGAVVDGIDDVEVDTNFGNHSVQGNQPRTAVGLVDANHLLFVVVDGRSNGYSRGVVDDRARPDLRRPRREVAYNLDGGGSSAMVFQGDLVNNPLGRGEERGTSDILYVAG